YAFDHLKAPYAKLLEQHLLGRKGVLLVEIAEARAIGKEVALADAGSTLERRAPLYFLGDYRNEGKGDGRRVTVGLKLMRGQNQVAAATRPGVSPNAVPGAIRQLADELAAKVLGLGRLEADPASEAA